MIPKLKKKCPKRLLIISISSTDYSLIPNILGLQPVSWKKAWFTGQARTTDPSHPIEQFMLGVQSATVEGEVHNPV